MWGDVEVECVTSPLTAGGLTQLTPCSFSESHMTIFSHEHNTASSVDDQKTATAQAKSTQRT